MEVLLVGLGGIIGLLASLVVETFRSGRERERWRMERRYEVYVTALSHVDELLTWARNETTNPVDSPPPEGHSFHEFAARLALVGSKKVQDAWADLDAAFRQFPQLHLAAINATRAAHADGHADSADAIRLRGMLDEIVTNARKAEVELSKAMERDL